MPYIRPELRDAFTATNPGELNYHLTTVALEYLEAKGTSYATLAEIVAAFECAKLEFYRRVIVPYEETKRAANGDVYPVTRPTW